MKEPLFIVKIGGQVVDDDASLSLFLQGFAALPGRKMLVHGGGKMATSLAERLQVPQRMIAGRRVTDGETLKIVTMVYAGYINKTIVAGLQALDSNALGICGADGNLLQAHKRAGTSVDYGFAGDIDQVNSGMATQLLEAGFDLVIAPLTHDRKGLLLNTNADTVAQELAQALSATYAVQLVYCFEKKGVLADPSDERSVIPVIDAQSFDHLKKENRITDGMIPKLSNALAALGKGVSKVSIGRWDQLHEMIDGTAGTLIAT